MMHDSPRSRLTPRTFSALSIGSMFLASLASPGRAEDPSSAADDAAKGTIAPGSAAVVAGLLEEARKTGDARRGAQVFASPKFACLSCHRVGAEGGPVGPDLTTVGLCVKPEEIVESLLFPSRQVKSGYNAVTVATTDGAVRQGYEQSETKDAIVLRDPAKGDLITIAKADVAEVRKGITLMPEGLAEAMSATERRDLVRFLLDLGRPGALAVGDLVRHSHAPAEFAYDRAPLNPEEWPSRRHAVNRDRVYDFYAKEAEHFMKQPIVPPLLPPFPGLDGGRLGHWGNQNDDVWADDRWNSTDLGNVLAGVFRGAGVTVAKGVCLRLGERGELSACFNPETLCYEALWTGGFLKFAPKRHGILDGLIMNGTPLPRPEGSKPDQPFVYRGFYRHGSRVIFAYRVGDVEMLDAPWAEDGRLTRVVAPAAEHPLRHLTQGGPSRWPEVLETKGTVGRSGNWPYVVDTITPPYQNPWNALMFFGGHDFLPDGSALICTIQGDVWRVDGLDTALEHVRWRRFASGLHQALGLVVSDGRAYVLGRDQITRLTDLDGDGEADFYENFCNRFQTSPAGHDFICGLERDASGRFYTSSGKQGLVRIAADGTTVETIATGFRNPDGLGLAPDGTLTVPCSEGDWTCASMICEIRPGGHYGYLGPRDGRVPELPLVYLPRGLDNSSGGQVTVPAGTFGPLAGQMIHFSHGAGTHFLVLREKVDGRPQGAIVPLPGEFLSGVHRARFHPVDGQLYASGMTGWGTYTPLDGSFERVRYKGGSAQLPTAFRAHENGVLVTFAQPLDRSVAEQARRHFAQAWNYRYGPGYGSQELSTRHAGQAGHDPLAVASAHVLADGKSVFLEMPDIQPVNQIHLHMKIEENARAIDLIATVHKLAAPFTGFPGYAPRAKTIAAHPILADMAALSVKREPNPWRKPLPNAREIAVEAGKNLSFSPRTFTVKGGEPIRLTFLNPDVVPHNVCLVQKGTLARFGDLVNRMVADPEAALRHYIPRTEDVLAYTDVVGPGDQFTISFRAPDQPGRYPFLCTFPGHWMVMNGEMVVETTGGEKR